MKVLNSIDAEYYTEVTNSGVMCKKCKKPIANVQYVKIFKVNKSYLPENGFAEAEMKATLESVTI